MFISFAIYFLVISANRSGSSVLGGNTGLFSILIVIRNYTVAVIVVICIVLLLLLNIDHQPNRLSTRGLQNHRITFSHANCFTHILIVHDVLSLFDHGKCFSLMCRLIMVSLAETRLTITQRCISSLLYRL